MKSVKMTHGLRRNQPHGLQWLEGHKSCLWVGRWFPWVIEERFDWSSN